MKSRFNQFAALILLIISAASFYTCKKDNPGSFNAEAKASVAYTPDGTKVDFGQILEKHKGKKIVVDVWASWCGDCWRNFPKLAAVQKQVDTSKVDFVFLSIDEKKPKWQNAMPKLPVTAEHYWLEGDWDAPINEHLGVREIPTLVIIDENGTILNHDAANFSEELLLQFLK